MKSQAYDKPHDQNKLLQNTGKLLHAAVKKKTSPEEPRAYTSVGTRFSHSFSQVAAVFPRTQVDGQHLSTTFCPLSPQRCPFGGACHTCPPRVQAKLKIGKAGDRYEQEADRVADTIMQMSEPQMQRNECLPCNSMNEEDELIQTKLVTERITPLAQKQSEEGKGQTKKTTPLFHFRESIVKGKGEASIQAKTDGRLTPEVTPTMQDDIQSLQGGGRSLSVAERCFFEPRFGADFSSVCLHDHERANNIAGSINARAFTFGINVFFSKGEYSPNTSSGRKLIAHELTHVLQQNKFQEPLQTKLAKSESSDAAERQADDFADTAMFGIEKVPNSFAPVGPSIQRACGVAAIGTRTECDDQDPIFVTGHPFFKFNGGCDNFASGEEASLRSTAATLPATGSIEAHGFASVDGNPTFNDNLSCARALKARTVLTSEGIATGRIRIIKHGPTPGPTADRRSVVIRSIAPPTPVPTPPTPSPPTATITNETVATSPGSRARTTIGVGEEVNLTYSAGSATWATIGGTLSATTGATVMLTAPDTAQIVGVAAVGGGGTVSMAFTVIAPDSMHRDRFPGTGIRHTRGLPDSGIQTQSFLLPDTVNFGNTEYREVDSPATASGHWTCQIGDSHDTSPSIIPVASTVTAGKGSGPNGRDTAYSGHCGSAAPLTPGHKTWVIPIEYRVGSGSFHRIRNAVTQVHRLDADGSTCTSDKAGAHGATTVTAATSTF